jgi:hypothetical protein
MKTKTANQKMRLFIGSLSVNRISLMFEIDRCADNGAPFLIELYEFAGSWFQQTNGLEPPLMGAGVCD